MSEEALRFRWGVTRLKTAPHHQKDIHVTRAGLRSDVAPENDESLHGTCTTRQLIDTLQTRSDVSALRCAMPKVRDDIGQCGPIEPNGQIAQLVEGRPQHLPLPLTFICKLHKEHTNVRQRSQIRHQATCAHVTDCGWAVSSV